LCEKSRNDDRSGGRLIFVRHGESEGNRDRVFTTSPEVGLTEEGRRQAARAATRIARLFTPHLVVSSPYARARQTAEIIAGRLDLPVEIEPRLHERRFGDLRGKPYDAAEAARVFDAARHWHWRPPGEDGESMEDVRLRVASVLDYLTVKYSTHEVIVVSHGGVMLAVWAHLTGNIKDIAIAPNCGIVLVEYQDGRHGPPVAMTTD
jgi:broad specificity phosphatase PhoE